MNEPVAYVVACGDAAEGFWIYSVWSTREAADAECAAAQEGSPLQWYVYEFLIDRPGADHVWIGDPA